MINKHASHYSLILLTLLLSACNLPFGSPVAPAAEVPLATQALPPTPTQTPEPLFSEAPTIGSTISWFDTSTLVYVPAGEFVMGADEPEKQDFNPAHPVSLNGFWIYSTKVTNEMYNLCVSLGQCTAAVSTLEEPGATLSGTSLISFVTGPDGAEYALKDLPATNVTWDQADNYCKWVGGRLPTEAEWEKTARGEQSKIQPWGDDTPTCDLLNFEECGGFLSSVLDHPEGISDYKALDMAGNAYEWVNDWYAKDYYTQSPLSNPTGPVDGEKRSVRGSSFDSKLEGVFSALRSSLKPDQTKIDVGFRCVVENPAVFAPICEAPATNPVSASVSPQPGQSVSGNDGSIPNPEPLDLSKIGKFNSYCANKAAKLGGGTLTEDITPWLDYVHLNCNAGILSLTKDLPPSFKWWDVSAGGGPPIYKYAISGPQGASFEQTYSFLICEPKTITSSPQGVAAVCSSGYTLHANGTCVYTGLSSQPASLACPGGYSYNSETQCCTQNPPQAGSQTSQYPACGPGYIFDPLQSVCYKPPQVIQPSIPDSSATFQHKLGTCEEPPSTDKPSQPQPTPTFCDPATGACP
jgi:formylglycine-generating enzyme required for sulfatase activity